MPSNITDQVRIELVSQLIKDISSVLQKLLKYFNGRGIFTFIIPALLVLSKKFDLDLNDSESVTLSFDSSLPNW